VYLKDIWPSNQDIQAAVLASVNKSQFETRYAAVYEGTQDWRDIPLAHEANYNWPESTYIRQPVFFDQMTAKPQDRQAIENARCLALLGDSITTDHISPAGAIKANSPAGVYLQEKGVAPDDFNSYGSRRGNHEVMVRGTFANVRIQNLMTPTKTGGWTRCLVDNQEMTIFDAAQKYASAKIPLVVVAGSEYGTGSSRDWAAKGTLLLGVRAVIAQSFERIHRSNLIGMGVLPLEFTGSDSAKALQLTGEEHWSIPMATKAGEVISALMTKPDGSTQPLKLKARIDTPQELEYFNHGGILQYVLRNLLEAQAA